MPRSTRSITVRRRVTLLMPLFALGGCAASYTEPTLSSDHPASPAAAEAPTPTPSRTLDPDAADPVTPAAPGMHHGGHGTEGPR